MIAVGRYWVFDSDNNELIKKLTIYGFFFKKVQSVQRGVKSVPNLHTATSHAVRGLQRFFTPIFEKGVEGVLSTPVHRPTPTPISRTIKTRKHKNRRGGVCTFTPFYREYKRERGLSPLFIIKKARMVLIYKAHYLHLFYTFFWRFHTFLGKGVKGA